MNDNETWGDILDASNPEEDPEIRTLLDEIGEHYEDLRNPEFYESLAEQFERRGTLSEKQLAALYQLYRKVVIQ